MGGDSRMVRFTFQSPDVPFANHAAHALRATGRLSLADRGLQPPWRLGPGTGVVLTGAPRPGRHGYPVRGLRGSGTDRVARGGQAFRRRRDGAGARNGDGHRSRGKTAARAPDFRGIRRIRGDLPIRPGKCRLISSCWKNSSSPYENRYPIKCCMRGLWL